MTANNVKSVKFGFLAIVLAVLVTMAVPYAFSQAAGGAVSRVIGTIQTISGNSLTMKTDTGAMVNITASDGAHVLRVSPGEKDLKNAVPAQLTDIQVGDRVLAAGSAGGDGHTLSANSLIAIKKADVDSRQQKDMQDWQKRGVGGLVSAVDATAGTVSVKVGAQAVTIHASKTTVVRRYAPDSVRFDDAKTSTLDAIKVGDQVRARGARDGNDMTAEEIVSGGFRNLSGAISAVNAASSTINLTDLATKKPMTIAISPDSQMRKLSPEVATQLAGRLKRQPGGGAQGGESAANGAAAGGGGRGGRGGGGGGAGGGGRGAGGGAAGEDLAQVIASAPQITIADLQKGDAIMLVSTEGNASGQVTAVTLVAGVEPILQAAPDAGGMTLPAWNLGGGGGGGGEGGGGGGGQ